MCSETAPPARLTRAVGRRSARRVAGGAGAELAARVPRAVRDALRHAAADGHLQKLPTDIRAHHAAVRRDRQADALLPENGELVRFEVVSETVKEVAVIR